MDTTTYDGSFDGDDLYDHVADADDPRTVDARDEDERYMGPQHVEHDVWSGAHSDDLD